MNTNNIIAIVATSLLCITAVPPVLSFGGYVVSSKIKNAPNYQCQSTQQQQDVMLCQRRFMLTDNAPLRHSATQLQMNNDKSSTDRAENERRVSKRKRLWNFVRRNVLPPLPKQKQRAMIDNKNLFEGRSSCAIVLFH